MPTGTPTEIERAKTFAASELKRLNDKLASERRTASRSVEGVVEAGMTVSRFTSSVNELTEMLEAVERFNEKLRDTDNG